MVLIAALTPSGCASISAQTTAPSLAEVRRSLDEGDPGATLAKYFACDSATGSAYEQIAQGAPERVALAESLLQHSDACYTEGIQDALGRAMQLRPRNVLPLVDKRPELAGERICLPFLSDELAPELLSAEVSRSRNAIEQVDDANLAEQRKRCLQVIGAAGAALDRRWHQE